MYESAKDTLAGLSVETQSALVAAARDGAPVRGLTHGFYKYPARFSPIFARAAIETFTQPGDLVLDPHVGGGTSLVEALAAGREGVGVDISTLAEFVTGVKCTVFSEAELVTLERWAQRVSAAVNIHKPSTTIADYEQLGYYKHLKHPSRWRLRKAIEQSITSATRLSSPRLEAFGRCVVLRAAQWALDGRSKITGIGDFRRVLHDSAQEMIAGAHQLRATASAKGEQRATIFRRSAIGMDTEAGLREMRAPRLVLTSPPYPGVHVLYHRWQVDGRKEAPLPFMIANKLDGSGSSYYTMGDRKNSSLNTYFDSIRGSMSSVAALADDNTIVVQMVAFSSPDEQLPRYLSAMEASGLKEMFLPLIENEGDGRLWRSVPGRRWYSAQRGETPGSKEVVLFHRRAIAQDRHIATTFQLRPSA